MCKPSLILFLLCGLFSFRAARSQQVTLNRDQALLQELFLEIHQQTGYFFYYANNDLDEAKPVTIHVSKAPLEEVLGICFSGQPLIYRIDNKTIVVQKKPFVPASLIDLKGKVQTEQGEPLEDVSVELAGTHKVISTGSGGEFSLDKVNENAVLNFSHVGYEARSVTLNKNQYLTVILKRSVSKLDEVQVIAYGTTTRRLNTGNVSTLKSEDIQKQPISDPLSALEGRVSGLSVIQRSGVAGSSFQVQIRGKNSIANGNDPLYIVDGVPFPSTTMGSVFSGIILYGDPLGSIDPATISSIDVLKDADATAIYGSRGANGVILITTKKGVIGKTRLDVSAYSGVMKLTRSMNLLSTPQYIQMRTEAFSNDGMLPSISNAPDLLLWDTTRNTNWQKVLLGGTGQINDVHTSISGGDSSNRFLISGGYHRETTVFPGDFADQKVSAHTTFQHVSADNRLSVQLTAEYLQDNNHLPGSDPTARALTLPPDAPPIYDSEGNLNWAHSTWDNPLAYTKMHFQAKTESWNSNLLLNYHLAKEVELTLSAGYNRLSFGEISTYPQASYDPARQIVSGSAASAENNGNTWILEPQLVWKRKCVPGLLHALLGSSFQGSTATDQTLDGFGISNDALIEDLGAAASVIVYDNHDRHYKYQALFARVSYDINAEWIIDLTARRDGSSRFGPGRQFATFGAVGAAWIFSKRPYFQIHFHALSFGKLRGSFGITGNDQIGDYQYLSTYSATSYPYQGATGLFPDNLSNPDYGWERNNKWEGALETGWFNDRLLVSTNYYRNRSSNQLVGYAVPLITGFHSVVANLPAIVQNDGWEFDINARVIQTRTFKWSVSANFSFPKDKLIAFPGLASSTYSNRYVIGKSLGIVHGFKVVGVDPQTGIYTFADNKGTTTNNPIYPDDLFTDRQLKVAYFGGIENSFTFRRWRMDIFFQVVKQTGRNYMFSLFSAPGMPSNQPAEVAKRWQKSGDESPIQRYTQDYGSAAASAYSDINFYGENTVKDASFASLKNVALSYQLDPVSLGKLHIRSLKIYLQAQNIFTFSSFVGLNPQTQSFGSIPLLTTATAGFQISF